MAGYKVGTTQQGSRVWWAGWQNPGGFPGTTDVRDASDEEAELMEKIVWDRDTAADLTRLRNLIQPGDRT